MRVSAGQIQEPEDDISRHGYAMLVVDPRRWRNIQSAGHSFDSILSVEILADFADALGELSVPVHVIPFP